ncbi:hypothetical protein PHLGIDRAFT_459263 [Phlebiopsis gigantea 11061_1 CR5-6]|uniref:Uncharacterized protein n=1 Tax=Phlebiopsis gigantea (strain 11061_1 CR5-6) TaxID=745531 RepID=A0A0C3PJR2_PHLG1|nr:hypothetical protein PHLGIDRAFT_459263 [Phlebiopsis gigantea 11061_1 CR5-6]
MEVRHFDALHTIFGHSQSQTVMRYEFNGRQLKVHFDKFAAPSSTALPAVHSLSGSQSPLSHLHPVHQSSPQGLSFAQQVLLQQHHFGKQQDRSFYLGPAGLQRSLTESQSSRFSHVTDDRYPGFGSETQAAGRDLPGVLNRAQSDTIQQLLQGSVLRPPSPSQPAQDAHFQVQDEQPLHISMPPFRPSYAFDFSPGLPYDLYHLTSGAGGFEMDRTAMQAEVESSILQSGGDLYMKRMEMFPDKIPSTDSSRPSTSPAPISSTGPQKQTHSHSQSESYLGSNTSEQSQPTAQTQATSPVVTSPTSTHSSALHSHPAHPGPISLPPPPPVTAFPIPPTHTLSPVYHPQMSPYGSPMHHGMMMGMVGMSTPHGLPPITPSMPSFTFLPQPSPGAPPAHIAEPSSAHSGQQALSMSARGDPQQQMPGNYVAHLHHTHGGMLSPYTPFSPGVAISPGAFWGRPGSGPNPYINPAVGAPVHSGYFPPVSPHAQAPEEGYFPPFVSSNSTSRPSGLANEIQIDQSSVGGSTEDTATNAPSNTSPDSVFHSEGTTTGTTTGTEVSPRPPTPSSRGTSYHSDSANPSPMQDLMKEMESLAIRTTLTVETDAYGQQRSRSTGANDSTSSLGAPMVRSGSDPTSTTSSMTNLAESASTDLTLTSHLVLGLQGKT